MRSYLLTVNFRIASAPLTQSVDRDGICVELTVRVGDNAAEQRNQFGGASIVRAEKDSLRVVVVRMKIVPDERLPLENVSQLLNFFRGDYLADDF